MGYIDENLMNGEQVVHRSKLHWIIFLGPIVLAFIAFMFFALAALAFLVGDQETTIAAGSFFFFLIAIIWAISAFISFKASEFGITNKRVLIKVGFIRRNSLETLLAKVEGIQVNQGILGRMFNYGTIMVKGTGGTSTPFHKIEAPMEFRKKAQEQIASIESGDTKVGTIAYEKLHGTTQDASFDQQVSDDKDLVIHKPSFCSNCGFKIASASTFCSECGSQLSYK